MANAGHGSASSSGLRNVGLELPSARAIAYLSGADESRRNGSRMRARDSGSGAGHSGVDAAGVRWAAAAAGGWGVGFSPARSFPAGPRINAATDGAMARPVVVGSQAALALAAHHLGGAGLRRLCHRSLLDLRHRVCGSARAHSRRGLCFALFRGVEQFAPAGDHAVGELHPGGAGHGRFLFMPFTSLSPSPTGFGMCSRLTRCAVPARSSARITSGVSWN